MGSSAVVPHYDHLFEGYKPIEDHIVKVGQECLNTIWPVHDAHQDGRISGKGKDLRSVHAAVRTEALDAVEYCRLIHARPTGFLHNGVGQGDTVPGITL